MNSQSSEDPNGPSCGAIDEVAAAAHDQRITELHKAEYRSLVRRLAAWAQSKGAPSYLGVDVADEAFEYIYSMENPPNSPEVLAERLYDIARRLMKTSLKGRGRRDRLLDKFPDELVPSMRGPELLHMDLQQKELLDRIVNTGSERQQIVFRLRLERGLSFGEIVTHLADMGTNVNEKTVRRDIEAIKERCRAEFAALENPTQEGCK